MCVCVCEFPGKAKKSSLSHLSIHYIFLEESRVVLTPFSSVYSDSFFPFSFFLLTFTLLQLGFSALCFVFVGFDCSCFIFIHMLFCSGI